MANVKIRASSIYVAGKKVGQFENAKYSINSGDEPQFGDPGFIGYSDGAITTSLTANGIVPVPGMDYDFVTAMKNKQDLDIAITLINGKIHQVTMRCTKAEFSGSHKAGTLMGDFELGGGEPNVTG